MTVAATEPCDDFPAPKDPADLSAGYGEHTVSPDYESTTAPTDPTETTDTDGDGVPDDGYDDDLYAPGAGQEPLPTPGAGNQGGGPPGGGPPGGGPPAGGPGGGGDGGVAP
jgi:hypothetical protein